VGRIALLSSIGLQHGDQPEVSIGDVMLTDAPPRMANRAGFPENDRIGSLNLPQDTCLLTPSKSIESAMRAGKAGSPTGIDLPLFKGNVTIGLALATACGCGGDGIVSVMDGPTLVQYDSPTRGSSFVTVGDFDDDGKPDLVIAAGSKGSGTTAPSGSPSWREHRERCESR
jgi:FG-GAP repeat